ncbi:FHA domain-containing protein [Granulosicoccus sp. 3-233]|uniref:FHA domain-containing protein n=1 Tax=Granulosicoccus sp. 3-233 TaxID=3417969 RepID=UPI003D335DBA
MTTIIVTHEDNEVDEFDFNDGQDTISIGRRSSNDVCIPDLSVSGNHALITLEGGEFWLEDLNSTNGTYINGQVVQRQTIRNNDEIIIGKIRITFHGSDSLAANVATTDAHAASAPVSSDFGDGHVESIDEIDALAMNEASEGIEDHRMSAGPADRQDVSSQPAHPMEGVDNPAAASTTATPGPSSSASAATADTTQAPMLELESAPANTSRGAVIEIKNGAKSGQILPIDKPVTTLGRPGIQIAAIMRKPDGYFLMHIESDDSVERPTLNRDAIGDEPVLLHSGDELNVAGIDVEFMLS